MPSERANSRVFRQLSSELLADDLSFRFQARGKSMFPTILDGEIVQVRGAKAIELRVGDIVLFDSNEGLKVHRIINMTAESVFTRGDAGIDIDGETRRERILGKVMAKQCRRTGQVIRLSGTCAGAAFFWRKFKGHIKRWRVRQWPFWRTTRPAGALTSR